MSRTWWRISRLEGNVLQAHSTYMCQIVLIEIEERMKGRCRESLHENGLDSARTRFCYFFERHNGTKDTPKPLRFTVRTLQS